MTAKKALVYAKGGGEGHLRRGSLASLWLHQLNYETTLVVREDQIKPLARHSIPEIELLHTLPCDSEKYDQVIIDTFPQGWRNEFHPRRLFKNASLSLISRINRDENWAQESEAYDQLISPYPEALSEWEREKLPKERFAGLMVNPVRYEFCEKTLLIIDPLKRLPANLISRMTSISQELGYKVDYLVSWTKETLFVGSKIFVVGAGYNTFYEWLGTDAEVKFLPLVRRWDDQVHRARRLDLAIQSLPQWLTWLKEPSQRSTKIDQQFFSNIKAFQECLCHKH